MTKARDIASATPAPSTVSATIVPKFRATRSEKVFKFFRFFCCDLPIGKNSSSPTILSSTLSNAI